MKKFLIRLFCHHEYEVIDSCLVDCGMRKMITSKCEKCGRVKVEFV